MTEEELVRFCREQNISLVGIGAMTRMIARAFRVADALRAAGIAVVMGGPHVLTRFICRVPSLSTSAGEMPDADHIFVGEAKTTLPEFLRDLKRGKATSAS
jgi:radical SAM superfamily enzyme YgiQ (UPF0313 family)